MSNFTLHPGDCIEILKTYPDNYFDSCVTDPPYLISFMGLDFDKQHKDLAGANDGQRMQAWHYKWAKEVLRVLKPGAHLLAFSSTRTYHRMACAIEDAGFEIRDQVGWLFASGMAKSHDVSKQLDRAEYDRREKKIKAALKEKGFDVVVWNIDHE